jgi:hypothetical protein
MNQQLHTLREAVAAVKSIAAEVKSVQEEQARTKAAVETAVASGDETKIDAIIQDRTRLELFPARIAKLREPQDAAISRLREELESATLAIVRQCSDDQKAAQKRIQDFLQGELAEPYRAETFAREIAPNSKQHQAAESVSRCLHPNAVRLVNSVEGLLSLAERVIGHLEKPTATNPS